MHLIAGHLCRRPLVSYVQAERAAISAVLLKGPDLLVFGIQCVLIQILMVLPKNVCVREKRESKRRFHFTRHRPLLHLPVVPN